MGPTRKSATHSGSAYFYDNLAKELNQGALLESDTLNSSFEEAMGACENMHGGKGWAMGEPTLAK